MATRKSSAKENVAAQEPLDAARAASLRYVSDAQPGIARRKRGSGFFYLAPDGKRVADRETLSRIKALAIPPAWTDVWISASANGHIQATGRDARGRKQYRYHTRWRAIRDENKYARLLLFGRSLPAIRARVQEDLTGPALGRSRILAAVVHLLATTYVRVGNDEYSRTNKSFGLTTLRNEHVKVEGATVRFRFRGKSGKQHEIEFSDRRMANLIRRLRDLPGQDLFQYTDDGGETQPITSADVNDYLRSISGEDITAKDFRTWAGTLLATRELANASTETSGAQSGRSAMLRAVEAVAESLGNTPAICRKCYIHPDILRAFEEPELREQLAKRVRKRAGNGLDSEELTLLRFLEKVSG